MKHAAVFLFAAMAIATPGARPRAEEIKLATYNVEYFDDHFLADHLTTSTLGQSKEGKTALGELAKKNNEDNWETAQTILDPQFNPDILVMEEACDQKDLDYFNHRWLKDAYATAIQFPTNSTRHQNLDLLMKPGFKILETRDKYYLEPDPVGNERGGRLFARGPAFVKVETPGGKTLWVGVTHMKSKHVLLPRAASAPAPTPVPGKRSGDDMDDENVYGGEKEAPALRKAKIEATKWRIREAKRTHEIIKELEKEGPTDVILLGDMNDSLGMDPYEPEAGGDAVEQLVEPKEDGLTLATRELAGTKAWSFNGYWRTAFREFIDHVVVTASMKDKVESVQVFTGGMAKVSSDHFPVLVKAKLD